MTWTAKVVVQDVSEGPSPIDVLCVASADDSYVVQQVTGYNDEKTPNYKDVEVSRVMSNTEGKIQSVELKLVLDVDSTNLKVGDEIMVSGHFTG